MSAPGFIGSRPAATAAGILAILLWSTSVAVSRSVIEHLGLFTGGGLVHLLGGGIALVFVLARREKRAGLTRLSWRYLLGCGAMFVLYLPSFYLALGWAADRQQVVEIGIVNYLWPSLTLLLSVPILGKRANLWIVPGMMLACGGIILAAVGSEPFSWAALGRHFTGHPLPYVAILVCVISWPLFSNFSRLWAGDADTGAVPLFLMAAGAILLSMRLFVDEDPQWTPGTIAEFLYAAIFPTFLAYELWDTSMRKGNLTLVVVLSYLIPILSTVVSWLYLQVPLPSTMWMACGLVAAGALICKRAVTDPPSAD